jgi:predicted nucleotidyltransferase
VVRLRVPITDKKRIVMNIHFTDKELFENLKKATLAKVRVGSHLYGTNNENSDEDFLYIYATSENELKSFVWTNHQLQYKEEGIDHNFVSLHSFVRNIINGDSTINFEVVHSQELKGTWLEFLHVLRNSFNTYTVMRSYNGLARRDCKHFTKGKTVYERRKRFGHIVRGWLYTDMLMRTAFTKTEFDFNDANDEFKMHMEAFGGDITMTDVVAYAESLDAQRRALNTRLEDKQMPKMMNVQNALNLQAAMSIIQNNCKDYAIAQSHLKDFDMSIFINAFENWVSYE